MNNVVVPVHELLTTYKQGFLLLIKLQQQTKHNTKLSRKVWLIWRYFCLISEHAVGAHTSYSEQKTWLKWAIQKCVLCALISVHMLAQSMLCAMTDPHSQPLCSVNISYNYHSSHRSANHRLGGSNSDDWLISQNNSLAEDNWREVSQNRFISANVLRNVAIRPRKATAR